MPHTFDATLKDIVAQYPADFAGVFGLPTNVPTTSLNIDLSTVSAATDIALGFDNPLKEIVDVNVQSGPDPGLPGRLHLYNAALHHRYDVAVRSILVLLRPKADSANLTGKLVYGQNPALVEFEYEAIRLWQGPVDDYFSKCGLAALPLATLCKMPKGQSLPDALRDVVHEIDRRLKLELEHATVVKLMTAAYILTGLRVTKHSLATIYRGIGLMQESTAFDEATEEGEIKRSHRVLLRQGRKLIGSLDTSTEAEITAIKDLDRLDRLTDAILTAKSWQELLDTP